MAKLIGVLGGFVLIVFSAISIGEMLLIAIKWEQVPAAIESVAVSRSEPVTATSNYLVTFSFNYQVDGNDYTSRLYSPRSENCLVTAEPELAKEFANSLKESQTNTCWVNPQDPDEAVLKPFDQLQTELILMGVGLFIFLISMGGDIYDAIRCRLARKHDNPQMQLRPQLWRSVICLVLMMATVVGLFISERIEQNKAESWIETSCIIEESSMSFRDNEWRPHILYRWQYEGQDYQSKRVHFATWNGPVLKVEEVVSQYPAGAERVCHIDPDRPSRAVLIKKYQSGDFMPLILLGAIGICVFVIIQEVRQWRHQVWVWEYENIGNFEDGDVPEVGKPASIWPYAAFLIGVALAVKLMPAVYREWQLGVWFTISQIYWLICTVGVLLSCIFYRK